MQIFLLPSYVEGGMFWEGKQSFDIRSSAFWSFFLLMSFEAILCYDCFVYSSHSRTSSEDFLVLFFGTVWPTWDIFYWNSIVDREHLYGLPTTKKMLSIYVIDCHTLAPIWTTNGCPPIIYEVSILKNQLANDAILSLNRSEITTTMTVATHGRRHYFKRYFN